LDKLHEKSPQLAHWRPLPQTATSKFLEASPGNEIYANKQVRFDLLKHMKLAQKRLSEPQDPAYLERLKGFLWNRSSSCKE
jgi:hypothetical protein